MNADEEAKKAVLNDEVSSATSGGFSNLKVSSATMKKAEED